MIIYSILKYHGSSGLTPSQAPAWEGKRLSSECDLFTK